MIADLIYDVGMHDGTDTDFYLKKGFRVVAIEANPELVAEARGRFSGAIASGRLTVLNVAISDHDGLATFYRSPEHQGLTFSPTVLSTTDGEIADDYSRRFGAHFETIEVESRRLETILEQYGVPYYLKVDIEGADVLCVRALEHVSPRPQHVSIELPRLYPERHYKELCHLYLLDYRWFKIIDQRFLDKIKLPSPAREGNDVSHEFAGNTSGPFGEETPGRWLSFEEIVSLYKTPTKRKDAWLRGSTGAWFDLHAKLDEEGSFLRAPPESTGLYPLVRAVIRRASRLK